MRDDLRGMTTEELQALRDQLKARPKAKPTPARLHPNATTADVLRVMSQADAILTELRPSCGNGKRTWTSWARNASPSRMDGPKRCRHMPTPLSH
jgi:hypothetical protein